METVQLNQSFRLKRIPYWTAMRIVSISVSINQMVWVDQAAQIPLVPVLFLLTIRPHCHYRFNHLVNFYRESQKRKTHQPAPDRMGKVLLMEPNLIFNQKDRWWQQLKKKIRVLIMQSTAHPKLIRSHRRKWKIKKLIWNLWWTSDGCMRKVTTNTNRD